MLVVVVLLLSLGLAAVAPHSQPHDKTTSHPDSRPTVWRRRIPHQQPFILRTLYGTPYSVLRPLNLAFNGFLQPPPLFNRLSLSHRAKEQRGGKKKKKGPFLAARISIHPVSFTSDDGGSCQADYYC